MKKDYMVVITGSCIDEFYSVPTWVAAGDGVQAQTLGSMVGGCMLNVGIVASHLGLDVCDIDYLNDTDSDTGLIVSHMAKHGINTDFVATGPQAQNGKCIIMGCGGDKVIFVIEATHPQHDMADGKMQALLNGASVIFSMMKDMARAFGPDLLPIKIAKQHGAKIVFDGQSHFESADEIQNVKLADALILNDVALSRLHEKMGGNAVRTLFSCGATYVCETLGSKGARIFKNDDTITCSPSLPIKNVVDSTGAGDTFIASFIYGWMQGWDEEKIIKFATSAGARACTIMGGDGGAATAQEVIDFAKQYGVII